MPTWSNDLAHMLVVQVLLEKRSRALLLAFQPEVLAVVDVKTIALISLGVCGGSLYVSLAVLELTV